MDIHTPHPLPWNYGTVSGSPGYAITDATGDIIPGVPMMGINAARLIVATANSPYYVIEDNTMRLNESTWTALAPPPMRRWAVYHSGHRTGEITARTRNEAINLAHANRMHKTGLYGQTRLGAIDVQEI